MVDFNDFSPKAGTTAKPDPTGADLRWWKKSGSDAADSVTATLVVMNKSQSARLRQLVTSARLYGNLPMLGASGANYSSYGNIQGPLKDRLSHNVVQSATDAIIAKLSKNRPKPYFLTQGGDYKVQRKAKKLNQFTEGIFYECKAYEIGEAAARDAAIDGDGIIHVFERHGRVCMERCNASEFYVDDLEAFYGKPRQLHRVINVDRDVLRATVKGHAAVIADANAAPNESAMEPNTADVVLVRESWHLPSGPDATDGKHLITLAGEVLLSESWSHEFFPFARFQWCPRKNGFWSQGLAEQIAPIQFELNKLLHALQVAYQRACLMVIFLENGSKVVKSHIDNEIARIITYTGTVPQYQTPPVVPPEIYTQIETLIRRGYEIAGVSQLSSASQKPAGLNSGKALREFEDIESDRFTTISKAYERFYLDLARVAIAVAKDIYESEGGYEVKTPGKRFLSTIDWKKIDLEEDDYTMQCFPVSSLPNDPAGRLQTVQEYIQAGMIPPDVGMKLLEFPDTQQYETLQNAMEDRLQEILDGIVDEGEYSPPEPFYQMKRAQELTLQYIILGESQKLEPERMELLLRFKSQLDAFAKAAEMEAQQQAMIQAAAQGGAANTPPADPQATPQSDMIPNVNAPGAVA